MGATRVQSVPVPPIQAWSGRESLQYMVRSSFLATVVCSFRLPAHFTWRNRSVLRICVYWAVVKYMEMDAVSLLVTGTLSEHLVAVDPAPYPPPVEGVETSQ